MGSTPSQAVGHAEYNHQQDYFRSTRSLRTPVTHQSVKHPADTRSTILRVEKTQKDMEHKKEKEFNQQNGLTPFTPRGTIGYSIQPSPKHGSKLPVANRRKKADRGRGQSSRSGVSFNTKNVYISDEDLWNSDDDGLTGKEKIESYLRRGRVPETKVRSLAVKIFEQARKEQQGHTQNVPLDTTHMRTTLKSIIQQPLDLMLYGKANKTNLKQLGNDLNDMVQKVSDMVELLETDMALCFDSVERRVSGKPSSKSVPLVIRDAVLALETDYDILHDKYHELRKEMEEAVHEQAKTKFRTEALEETSLQVEKEFKRLADENREMSEYLRQVKAHRRQLKTSQQELEEENARLKKQVTWYQESNTIVGKDVMKLQETCTQLQVQVAEQAKEIRRLKDPDKDLIYKIQRLETELTEAKTANRKLELEKGVVKTSLTKLQAQYDSLQRERGTLVKMQHKLQKENQKVKTTNKKLKLSS